MNRRDAQDPLSTAYGGESSPPLFYARVRFGAELKPSAKSDFPSVAGPAASGGKSAVERTLFRAWAVE